jgi:hypothetical protein
MSVYEMVSPGVPPTLRQLLIQPAATNSTPSAPTRPGRLPTARRLPATTPTATGHRPGPHDHLLQRRDRHRRTGGRTVTGHPLHQPCEPGSWRQPGMDDTSFPCQPTCPTPSPASRQDAVQQRRNCFAAQFPRHRTRYDKNIINCAVGSIWFAQLRDSYRRIINLYEVTTSPLPYRTHRIMCRALDGTASGRIVRSGDARREMLSGWDQDGPVRYTERSRRLRCDDC